MVSSPKLLSPTPRPTGGHSRHFFPPKRSFPRPTLSRPITEANGQQHPSPLPSLSNVVHFPPLPLPPVVIHDLWPTCIPTARRGREGGCRPPCIPRIAIRPICQEGGGSFAIVAACVKNLSLSLSTSRRRCKRKKNTGNSLSGRRRRWAYNEGGKSPLSPFSPSSADTFRTSREGRAEESGIQTGLKTQAAHTKSLLRTTVEK